MTRTNRRRFLQQSTAGLAGASALSAVPASALPSSCHLANRTFRVGRRVAWDGDKEQIVGDADAQRLVSRTHFARDPFTQSRTGVAPWQWDQFGRSAGGPLMKDKMFYRAPWTLATAE